MIRDRDPNELELQHMRVVVNALDSGLRRFAVGDLEATIDTPFPAHFEGMRRDFNRGLRALSGTMDSVVDNASLLRHESDSLRKSMTENAGKEADGSTRLSKAVAAAGSVALGLRQQKALAQHAATIAENAKLDIHRPREAIAGALKLIEKIGKEPGGKASSGRIEALSEKTEQIGRELDALSLYLDALGEHIVNLAEMAETQAGAASSAHDELNELAKSRRSASLKADIETLTLDRMDRNIAEIHQKASRFMHVTVITPPPRDPGTRGPHLRLVKS
ncbi:methyl-accepting chemotaxis protein [Rhizobium petrolearium]|uniref:methyl-accepting chemotaxis protein n=1 Tax=Neorhizobium petrolearium TaxID=515361 RepID=UPI001AE95462|nr:methyl-accepting chemotaxis protein [Neorhizobium petrolearium]MBP1846217.1 methyl-accepting chemotaxis protein [Neorhizobium petrolearium]